MDQDTDNNNTDIEAAETVAPEGIPEDDADSVGDVAEDVVTEIDEDGKVKLRTRPRRVLDRQVFAEGKKIIIEGEIGYTAYLIETGKVEVIKEKDGTQVKVAELGPGGLIGEMALIADAPRSATVVAVRDTTVVCITRALFEKKLESSDKVVNALLRAYVKKLQEQNNMLLKQQRAIKDMVQNVDNALKNMRKQIVDHGEDVFKEEMRAVFKTLSTILDKYQDQ